MTMADVIHMPCGCPYPPIGDHAPCVHGNNGVDEYPDSGPELRGGDAA